MAAREGAVLVDQWFVGCGASYVVCEGSSTQRYLGHSDNIVSVCADVVNLFIFAFHRLCLLHFLKSRSIYYC